MPTLPFATDVLVESLRAALHSPHRIQLHTAFGTLRQCLYIPPGSPVPAPTSCILPFYSWVLSGASHSSMQASCHLRLTSCMVQMWAPTVREGSMSRASTLCWAQITSSTSALPDTYRLFSAQHPGHADEQNGGGRSPWTERRERSAREIPLSRTKWFKEAESSF